MYFQQLTQMGLGDRVEIVRKSNILVVRNAMNHQMGRV